MKHFISAFLVYIAMVKRNLSDFIPSAVVLHMIMGLAAKIVADGDGRQPHNGNCKDDDL